jgi:hypothetical protein
MAQITLYLDEDTEAKLKAAAKTAGLSVSRWVAKLIREKTSEEWPDVVKSLAGAWRDLPTVEELRRDSPDDVPREPM